MIEIGLLCITCFYLLLLLAYFIPESPGAGMARFRQECKKQGMGSAETEAAVAIRVAFVRLRRMASDRCVEKKGEMSRKEINDIAGDLAIGLAAAHGQDAAKSFMGWVDTCEDSEILYDDARNARFRHNVEFLRGHGMWPPKAEMSHDLKDAFKIIR